MPDLDSLLASLGEDNVKPVAARVLAKRQAQLQEKMERIIALATESVIKAGHDQALKLTQGRLPDADAFYDSVYKTAREAGNRTCVDEMSELAKGKLEVDDTFKSELEGLVIDQAEMIAHKEYDRLEDRAASSAPTPAMPRFVALTLSLIIMGLVGQVCLLLWSYLASMPAVPAGQYQAPAAPTSNNVPAAAAPSSAAALPPSPLPGIANSVFNRNALLDRITSTAAAPPMPPRLRLQMPQLQMLPQPPEPLPQAFPAFLGGPLLPVLLPVRWWRLSVWKRQKKLSWSQPLPLPCPTQP